MARPAHRSHLRRSTALQRSRTSIQRTVKKLDAAGAHSSGTARVFKAAPGPFTKAQGPVGGRRLTYLHGVQRHSSAITTSRMLPHPQSNMLRSLRPQTPPLLLWQQVQIKLHRGFSHHSTNSFLSPPAAAFAPCLIYLAQALHQGGL